MDTTAWWMKLLKTFLNVSNNLWLRSEDVDVMDWFAASTSIIGAFINAHDARVATAVWLTSNVTFLIWSASTRTWSIFILNLVHLVINIRTLIVRYRKGT